MTPTNLDKRGVVVLNDTPFPPGAAGGGALKRYVEQGGGLLVVLGEHSTWPQNDAALLPGTLGAPSIVPTAAAARSASSTTAIRSSKCSRRRAAAVFSSARVFRYRATDGFARTAACSHDSTMAPWPRRNNGSASVE